MTERCHFCEAQKGAPHFTSCMYAPSTVHLYHCNFVSAVERQDAAPSRRQTARLDEFDHQVATITQRRGADYGPPRQDFERAQAIFNAIMDGAGNEVDPAVRHVFYMLAVKLARLRLTPTHLDSWLDIAGYARCGVTVTDDLLPGGSLYVAKS